MSLQRAPWLPALVLLGCRPHAAAPAPTSPGAPAPSRPATADCDGAQVQFEQVLAGQTEQLEGDARTTAQTRLQELAGVTRQRCREDGWPAEITACLIAARSEDEQRECALQMRADHHRRWFLQMMTGQPPGAASPDAELGPSCVQIEANHRRAFAAAAANAPAPPPDGPSPELVQGWVARILFERCLVDDWPETARTCFGRASVSERCEDLLPEAARTALRDHLIDMAESLGVPY